VGFYVVLYYHVSLPFYHCLILHFIVLGATDLFLLRT
jgi:hypothetical protein